MGIASFGNESFGGLIIRMVELISTVSQTLELEACAMVEMLRFTESSSTSLGANHNPALAGLITSC